MNRSDMTTATSVNGCIMQPFFEIVASVNGCTVYRAGDHSYFIDSKNDDGSQVYVAIYNCMPYENPSMSMMLVPMPYGEMR